MFTKKDILDYCSKHGLNTFIDGCIHFGELFYIETVNDDFRMAVLQYLNEKDPDIK